MPTVYRPEGRKKRLALFNGSEPPTFFAKFTPYVRQRGLNREHLLLKRKIRFEPIGPSD